MGDVEGVPEGAIEKEIKGLQSYKHDEGNGFRENGVLGGEQLRLLKEYGSKSIDEAENVKLEARSGIASESHFGSQNEPLSQVVRWNRFLPLQSLKVLLVENDDSTRQVVGALLRNCGYDVSNATNGVQAWKILEDLTVRIDLVLTEAAMPFLSGIGLLCKIMSHKTRKNTPVIMMSSVDSMNLVFQCLSKGAADFLFKPVRKNELKNLWQHVWRRCHSSSGSASESVVPKSKSVGESDNNTSSNDENDNASVGLNLRDGSDNGSGTQSSWTKRAVEVESPQPMSPWKLPAEAHDSTCARAQVIYPRPEISGNERVVVGFKRNITETKEFLDPVVMGRSELEIKVPTNSELQHQSSPREVTPVKPSGLKHNKLLSEGLKEDKDTMNCVVLCNDTDNHCAEERIQVDDKIGIGASGDIVIHLGVGPSETLTGPSIICNVRDKHVSDAKELPSLDQNLKRLRSIEDDGNSHKDERNVLRHSDQSAFSRYITTNSTTQGATGFGGSCCTPINDDNNSEAIKQESACNFASNSKATPINQGSNGSSNNNDMESTTKDFTKPTSVKDKLSPMSDSACAVHKSSAFHQLQHWLSIPSQQIAPEKVNDFALVAVGQAIGSHHQVQVQHHHYHYHHHHHRHHVHNLPQPSSPRLGHENSNQNSMVAAITQCGSSNAIGGPVENNGNYSINGSVSGSNHGSNGQNGSCTAANNGATNVESDNGTGGKSGADGSCGSGHGSRIEQNRSAQREAALTKFRLKRKERCYEKKVRYQTRKKLAEQRPRVRGQFVRQTTQGPKSEVADS